jgi:hypothetical protein
VRQAKAFISLAELKRQVKEENKQQEESHVSVYLTERRRQYEEMRLRLRLEEEMEAHARAYLAEIMRLN